MKKLKTLGAISFALIGGGALVSIPFTATSCAKSKTTKYIFGVNNNCHTVKELANTNLEGYRLYFKKQGVGGIDWRTLPYVNEQFCNTDQKIKIWKSSEDAIIIDVSTSNGNNAFSLYSNVNDIHDPSSYWTFVEEDTHYLGTLLTSSWVMQDESSITLIDNPLLNSTDNMYLEATN